MIILALQTQYEQLRLNADSGKMRQVRKAVRKTVSKQTVSRAAVGLVPGLHQLNCQKKIPHSTIDSALRHLNDLPKTKTDLGLGIYSCLVCTGFHVGHTMSKSKAASLPPEITAKESHQICLNKTPDKASCR
jgi:hypothetical protein